MKKFLILGNKNAITYKEFFPYFKKGEVCTGYEGIGEFFQPDGTLSTNMKGLCRWFSNLTIFKETELKEGCKYNTDKYLKYDNYDAINVDKLKELPLDYNGPMGVPITIIDRLSSDGLIHLNYDYSIERFRKGDDNKDLSVKDKDTYMRVIIKKSADYSIKGIADRQNTYGLRTKKYTEEDTPDYNDHNPNAVIKEDGKYKSKYSRVIIERV